MNTMGCLVSGRHALRLACLTLFAAIGMTGSPQAVHAQAADTQRAAVDTEAQLGEIVVTAEKRNSTIQSTPISITAFGERDLEQQGITSIEDIVRNAPGVSFRSAGPGQTELEMRGLSSAGGAAPTVGYYLDDASLTPPAQALNGKVVVDPNLFDIERVEVLRGPQGTLYGSGSMGGTIRIITNQPELGTFGGVVEVDGSGTVGGNTPNGTFNAALNIPIGDVVALRLVGTEKWVSGFIDRIVEDPFPIPTNNGCAPTSYFGCARGNVLAGNIVKEYKDVNWEHLVGGRAELLVRPSDDLSMVASAMVQRLSQGGYNTFDSPPGIDPVLAHYQPADIHEPYSDYFYLFSGTINYNMDFATLTSATSVWGRTSTAQQDQAEGFENAYALVPFNTDPDQWVRETDETHQISEEIRLASTGGGRLNWIAGAYYSDLKSIYKEYAASPYCAFSVGGCTANPDGIAIDVRVPYRITQYAGFGEISLHVTPTLTATLGARYALFENSLSTNVAGIFGPSGNGSYVQESSSGRDHAFTPKFNLAYIPDPNLTLYATASEGFRPGGVNQPLPLTGPNSCAANLAAIGLTQAPLTYAPDSIWNYELGEKARFFDQNLVINADIYYIRWKDIQQNIDLPCGTPYANNVGDAVSYGPELEVSYNLTHDVTLDANYVYTHARLTQTDPTSGLVVGQKIQNIPDYTENTSITYHRTVFDDEKLTLRLSNSLVGPTTDIAYTYVVLPAYDLLNTRAQLEKGSWTGAFYINNLTNKHAELTANDTSVSFNLPDVTRFSTNQPLTVGVDLHWKF